MIPTTTDLTTFKPPVGAAEAMTGSAVLALLRGLAMSVAALAAAAGCVAGLYLLKSALGIDLLPWNSPLHDLLYHLIR